MCSGQGGMRIRLVSMSRKGNCILCLLAHRLSHIPYGMHVQRSPLSQFIDLLVLSVMENLVMDSHLEIDMARSTV